MFDSGKKEKKQYDLERLFHPRTIAVIGIPDDPAKFGGNAWINAMSQLGYSGEIYPISKKMKMYNGLKVYSSLDDVPSDIDLAILCIPAQHTHQTIQDCIKKRIKFVHLFSAGFGETGADQGKKLEAGLIELIGLSQTRILGPNCMGIFSPGDGFCWRTDFPRFQGKAAFFSQSGWHSVEMVNQMRLKGDSLSKLVSYGNGYDLDEVDFLNYFARDHESKIIAGYIEGIKDGPGFLQALKKAAKIKPVVILKGGRTKAGSRASFSHTGSLAVESRIWDASIKQAGAISVANFEEMVDTALGLLYINSVQNRNIAIIGSGGGPGVLSSDFCEQSGLHLPPVPEVLQTELHNIIPSIGTGIKNPFDLPLWAEADLFCEAIRLIGAWSEIGLFIIQFEFESNLFFHGRQQVRRNNQRILEALTEIKKPVVVIMHTVGLHESVKILMSEQKRFMDAGIPVISTIRNAVNMIQNLPLYTL